MSGHTPWQLIRESRARTLTREDRAAESARHRGLVDALRFQVWRLRVEEEFVRVMDAAAAGEPVACRFRHLRNPHELTEQAAAKFENAHILVAPEQQRALAATTEFIEHFEAEHGPITPADYAAAEAFLDAITVPTASKEPA